MLSMEKNSLVDDTVEVSKSFSVASFHYISRKFNRAAHTLAKFDFEQKQMPCSGLFSFA